MHGQKQIINRHAKESSRAHERLSRITKFCQLKFYKWSKKTLYFSSFIVPFYNIRCFCNKFNTACSKTWPRLIGLVWPQSWPGLTFGLKIGLSPNFGLATKIGLASNLASTKILASNVFFFIFLHIWLIKWFFIDLFSTHVKYPTWFQCLIMIIPLKIYSYSLP